MKSAAIRVIHRRPVSVEQQPGKVELPRVFLWTAHPRGHLYFAREKYAGISTLQPPHYPPPQARFVRDNTGSRVKRKHDKAHSPVIRELIGLLPPSAGHPRLLYTPEISRLILMGHVWS